MAHSVDPEEIRMRAEEYYRSGDFCCSEAIVKTIKDAFGLPAPDTVVAMASGFPVGMSGAGCTCAALLPHPQQGHGAGLGPAYVPVCLLYG